MTEEWRRVLLEERVTHITDATGSSVRAALDHTAAARFTENCSAMTTVQLKGSRLKKILRFIKFFSPFDGLQ